VLALITRNWIAAEQCCLRDVMMVEVPEPQFLAASEDVELPEPRVESSLELANELTVSILKPIGPLGEHRPIRSGVLVGQSAEIWMQRFRWNDVCEEVHFWQCNRLAEGRGRGQMVGLTSPREELRQQIQGAELFSYPTYGRFRRTDGDCAGG
jgi:hypothetical protein